MLSICANMSHFVLLFLLLTGYTPASPGTEEAHAVPIHRTDSSHRTGVKVQLEEEYFKTLYNGQVKLFKLRKEDESFGQSIWINRRGEKLKAKYFASGEVYGRYEDWRQGKHIFLACSGAFTNDNSTPVGLTVDNGAIVNRSIDHTMDGLVIVYATGGIVVSDIDENNLYLASLKKSIHPRTDKSELLQWAVEEEATIFQTQLLVYKDQLRLEKYKARKRQRERRILVLAQNNRDDVYHIIFNIEEGVYLGDIAETLLEYLKQKSLSVVAMLNLDTGSYNILELYDDEGEQVDDIEGDEPINKATNLISYYYVK